MNVSHLFYFLDEHALLHAYALAGWTSGQAT